MSSTYPSARKRRRCRSPVPTAPYCSTNRPIARAAAGSSWSRMACAAWALASSAASRSHVGGRSSNGSRRPTLAPITALNAAAANRSRALVAGSSSPSSSSSNPLGSPACQRVNAGIRCECMLPILVNARSASATASLARPASSRQCMRKRLADRASGGGTSSRRAPPNSSIARSGSPCISATTPAMLRVASCTIGWSAAPGTWLVRKATATSRSVSPRDCAACVPNASATTSATPSPRARKTSAVSSTSASRSGSVKSRVARTAASSSRSSAGPPGDRSVTGTCASQRVASSRGSTLIVVRTSSRATRPSAAQSRSASAISPAPASSPRATSSSTAAARTACTSSGSAVRRSASDHSSCALKRVSSTARINGTRAASSASGTGVSTMLATSSSSAVPTVASASSVRRSLGASSASTSSRA